MYELCIYLLEVILLQAIEGYRETEISRWTSVCKGIINRIRGHCFPEDKEVLIHTHVLDLAEEGCIKPHVDSKRFCGNIIAGLCLGSQAIMRLVKENEKDQIVDVLLPKNSLYIMR